MSPEATDFKVRVRYYCFLESLFRCAKEELEMTLSQTKENGHENLASLWRDHLRDENIRTAFYQRITDQASSHVSYSSRLSLCVFARVILTCRVGFTIFHDGGRTSAQNDEERINSRMQRAP